jgi:hypothetical protein
MKVGFSENFTNAPLVVEFNPSSNISEMYFASINTSAMVDANLIYYEKLAFQISKLALYVCYAVVGIGWVSAFLGLFLRKLAGLEALIVAQMVYITMVELNSELLLPFFETFPLKLSTGYSPKLFPSNFTAENHSFPFISMSPPHLTTFSIDQEVAANNLNLFLILQIIPVFIFFIVGALIHFCTMMTKRMLKQEEEMMDNNEDIEHIERMIMTTQKLVKGMKDKQEMCYQFLMFFSVINIVNFVSSTVLFFKLNGSVFKEVGHNMVNFVEIVLALIFYTYCYVMFWKDPDPFNYFRYSFRRASPMFLHYYFYSIAIALTAFLITFLPQVTSSPPFHSQFSYCTQGRFALSRRRERPFELRSTT